MRVVKERENAGAEKLARARAPIRLRFGMLIRAAIVARQARGRNKRT